MTIKRVVPNIKTVRFEESSQFYVDFLGFNVAMDLGWIQTFVSPDNPAAQISVINDPIEGAIHPNISIQVDDIDLLYSKALELGFEIAYPLTDEPWGVRRFFVVDPNGIVLNLMAHLTGDR